VDSLHRGNLQKVTFSGSEGKEEKLYIAPNILFGALHVYDLNKERITNEALIKKEMIGKELGERLTEAIQQHQSQDQKPEQKPELKTTLSVAQSEKQEQKQANKQKEDKPVQKKARKQTELTNECGNGIFRFYGIGQRGSLYRTFAY
jgi:hypothetical protein